MDVNQRNKLWCVFELLPSDTHIRLHTGNLDTLNFVGDHPSKYTSWPTEFVYNPKKNTIKKYESLRDIIDNFTKKEKRIFIDNTPQHIHQLCQKIITETNFDLYSDREFAAISAYFKSIRRDIYAIYMGELFGVEYELYKARMQANSFAFLVPTSWTNILDTLKHVMISLFEKGGHVFPDDATEAITFVTELENFITGQQLDPYYAKLPKKHFKPENRCVMYEMSADTNSVIVSPVYFQLKQDESLKIFNDDRYVTPKVLEIYEPREFMILDHQELILRQILKLEQPIDSTIELPERYSSHKNANELLVSQILDLVKSYFIDRPGVNFDDWKNCYDFTEDHLDESLLAYIKSQEFLETVLTRLLNMWSNQMSEVIDYMKTIRNGISYFRVFEVVRKNTSFVPSTDLFVYYLQNRITCLFESAGTSNWSFVNRHSLDTPSSYFQWLSRKFIVSNMSLDPVIVEKDIKLNGLGFPIHIPLNNTPNLNNNSLPKLIIYLDISLNATFIVCKTVDKNGLIADQLNMEGFGFTSSLSSISKCFELEFGMKIKNNVKSCLELLEYKLQRDSKLAKSTRKNMKRIWKRSLREQCVINKSSKLTQIRSYLTKYFGKLIEDVVLKLKAMDIDDEKVSYVLCMEKSLMETVYISSRNELLDIFKENNIVDFAYNPRKLIIVDQGEREVWKVMENNMPKPRSYYVHAHMSDTHIYFKLKEVVDITEFNGGVSQSSNIFIKDKLVSMDSLYDQVADTLWNHLQSLDESNRETFISKHNGNKDMYLAFKVQLKIFIAEELFHDQATKPSNEENMRKHVVQLTNNTRLTITLQQLLDIAILPVLRKTISIITSCLLNKDAFGYFEIARLYITGSFLRTHAYNNLYHWFIISEMEKELKSQIREKTYKTTFEIDILTSKQREPFTNSSSTTDIGMKVFCYDTFLKGELRQVFNKTYYLKCDEDNARIHIENAVSSILTYCGDKIENKRLRVDLIKKHPVKFWNEKGLGDELIGPPSILKDIDDSYYFDDGPGRLWSKGFTIHTEMLTVHVEMIHHMFCIKITYIRYNRVFFGRINYSEKSFLCPERQTLKYF